MEILSLTVWRRWEATVIERLICTSTHALFSYHHMPSPPQYRWPKSYAFLKKFNLSFHSLVQYVTLANFIFSMKPIMLQHPNEVIQEIWFILKIPLIGFQLSTWAMHWMPFLSAPESWPPKCIDFIKNHLLFDVLHT